MGKWICNGVEFQVGDRVRISRTETTRAKTGMGDAGQWRNGWTPLMDSMLGTAFEIDSIRDSGAWSVDGHYGWPLTALEKLADSAEERLANAKLKLEALINEVEQLEKEAQ